MDTTQVITLFATIVIIALNLGLMWLVRSFTKEALTGTFNKTLWTRPVAIFFAIPPFSVIGGIAIIIICIFVLIWYESGKAIKFLINTNYFS